MLSQIPNFLSERLKLDTQTSPWGQPLIPHNASRHTGCALGPSLPSSWSSHFPHGSDSIQGTRTL